MCASWGMCLRTALMRIATFSLRLLFHGESDFFAQVDWRGLRRVEALARREARRRQARDGDGGGMEVRHDFSKAHIAVGRKSAAAADPSAVRRLYRGRRHALRGNHFPPAGSGPLKGRKIDFA